MATAELEKAAKFSDEDPYVYYLLAQAYVHSDVGKASEALQRALLLNPRHIPSLLA